MIRLGLLGHPVAHSRSSSVHAALGTQLGLEVRYSLHDVAPDDLANAIQRARDDGFTGLNLTLPHKCAAAGFASELSVRARRAGAVNTLRLSDLHGDNTDGEGLLRDLELGLGLSLRGMRVLVLGASGAARGATAALTQRELGRLVVANRDPARAAALAADIPGVEVMRYDELALAAFDLIVNATSASLADQLPPLPADPYAGAAYDMVVADQATVFQRWAIERGAILAADGWGMMVEQAALSWVSWGLPAPDPTPLLQPERVLRR